ncbi:MAG: DedA family protein, partial [Thermoprotei archaeon]
MSFTRAVVEASAELMRRMGYVGLFVLMTLESALVPIPSEVVMPLAGFLAQRKAFDFTLVVVIASLANLAGSLVAYALGASLGRRFVERFGKYL